MSESITKMTAPPLVHAAVLWTLLVSLLLPTATKALAVKGNPMQDFIKDIISRGVEPKVQEGDRDRGASVLEQLNLSSSTEPKRFYARPQQLPSLFTASVLAAFRLGSGVFANGYQVSLVPRRDSKYTIATLGGKYQIFETSTIPPKLVQTEPLILYEFEACPFCRKVREAVSILSLTVTFRPCPKNGNRYRPEIKEKYGAKATFPFLVDPNTGAKMFESDNILEYLFQTYGDGTIPWTLPLSNPIVPLAAGMGLLFRELFRGTRGATYRTSSPPPLPIQVWLYEGSPFCKLVRETLCELELEHTQVSCPRGSPNREKFFEEKGRFQVPYLEDPNSGVCLYESEAIIEYLQKQYGVSPSPVKYL